MHPSRFALGRQSCTKARAAASDLVSRLTPTWSNTPRRTQRGDFPPEGGDALELWAGPHLSGKRLTHSRLKLPARPVALGASRAASSSA